MLLTTLGQPGGTPLDPVTSYETVTGRKNYKKLRELKGNNGKYRVFRLQGAI